MKKRTVRKDRLYHDTAKWSKVKKKDGNLIRWTEKIDSKPGFGIPRPKSPVREKRGGRGTQATAGAKHPGPSIPMDQKGAGAFAGP